MTRRRARTAAIPRAAVLRLAAVLVAVAACGDQGPARADARPVQAPGRDAVADFETRARRHLETAQKLEADALAQHMEGRKLLAAGRRDEAESSLLSAGRLYESAAEERRRAYEEGDAARSASAAELRRAGASSATTPPADADDRAQPAPR